MRAFYDEATKPDSSFTTETHLRDEAEKLWQKSISYNANCDNKSQKYYARAVMFSCSCTFRAVFFCAICCSITCRVSGDTARCSGGSRRQRDMSGA